MSQRILDARLAGAALVLWIACSACLSPPVDTPTTTTTQDTPVNVSLNAQDQVDILFMVDNSSSMTAMQTQLVQRFGQFLQVFSDLAHPTDGSTPQYADLHIGVVTSDYGAGAQPGTAKTNGSGCDPSPGGQKGVLQNVAAAGGCSGPTGQFIQYRFSAGGDSCNLPGGGCNADALNSTFTCMASVGDGGCGFEHQLESVYAALTNSHENAGFLRQNAILAVVFVTNEDDGSAPPDVTFYNRDDNTPGEGAFDTYRQTHFGVACGAPAMLAPESASGGMLSCMPTGGSNEEYDVSRYIDFFNQLKSDRSQVILVALDAPEDDVETLMVKQFTGCGAVTAVTDPHRCDSATYVTCPATDTSCLVRLKHSCQNSAQPAFFGDPALRINQVVRALSPAPVKPAIFSICGDDPTQPPDYSATLAAVAQRIASQLKPPCIPAPLTSYSDPQCIVADVTTMPDKTKHTTEIPRCDTVGNVPPCWTVSEDAADCGCVQAADGTQHHTSISIQRSSAIPDNTVAQVSCSTEALLSYSCN